MLIGILQAGHSPEEGIALTGDTDALMQKMLDGHGFEFQTWAVCDLEFPNSLDAADGWLITGSKHGVYEDHMFIEPLEQLIQGIFASGKPLVGICFGHQIIAQALGGKVEKFNGGWGVGRHTYTYGEGEVALHAWHQDQVITPPESAVTIASNPFCQHAALLYGQRAFSIQAHPEFNETEVKVLIDHRGAALPADRLAYAQASYQQPIDNAAVASDIAAFFKLERD